MLNETVMITNLRDDKNYLIGDLITRPETDLG